MQHDDRGKKMPVGTKKHILIVDKDAAGGSIKPSKLFVIFLWFEAYN